MVIFTILLFISCKQKSEPQILVGYNNSYANSYYGSLSKKILINFFKQNTIRNYKFIEIDDSKYDNVDFLLSESRVQKGFKYNKILFKDAIYFLAEDVSVKEFNYPDNIYDLNTGIIIDSLSQKYVSENFDIKDNFLFYKDVNNLLNDFNNKKIQLVILDRDDYYKNLIILPKKYLFFVEIGEEFGYIYFKKEDHYNLFELFIKENNIKEKEWIKFVL